MFWGTVQSRGWVPHREGCLGCLLCHTGVHSRASAPSPAGQSFAERGILILEATSKDFRRADVERR